MHIHCNKDLNVISTGFVTNIIEFTMTTLIPPARIGYDLIEKQQQESQETVLKNKHKTSLRFTWKTLNGKNYG